MLGRHLFQIGRQLGRDSAIAWMRTVVIGFCLLVIFLGALGIALGLHQAAVRDARSRQLLPITSTSAHPATMLYRYQLAAMRTGPEAAATTTVIWIEPIGANPSPPPGLASWPAPGQAVVSPAVKSTTTARESSTYGRIVGTIQPAGLELATERRIYARPTRDALMQGRHQMTPISGFGPSGSDEYRGETSLSAIPRWQVVSTPALLGRVSHLVAELGGSLAW